MSTNQTSDQSYDTKSGSLAETYGLFIPGTHNTGGQISAKRVTDEGFRQEYFYVSNVAFATKRQGKLLLGISLTSSAFDVVFGGNTSAVCDELISTEYVNLDHDRRENILWLEQKGEVVFVEPNAIGLEGKHEQSRSFPIRTANYEKDVNTARMPFVSAGYGQGYMLGKVMNNLKENGSIPETRVFTMDPDHAADKVKDDEIVSRACWLDRFYYSSIFGACYVDVDYDGGLRGLLKPSEGNGVQISLLEEMTGKV